MTECDAIPVLMYHEIATATETASRLAVSPDAFAAQLRYLRDHGFTTLTAGAVAAALAGGGHWPPARSIVLTFDDGFADFHREALPVLLECGFTATLFATTGWVEDAGPLPAGRRPGNMLSWSQIAEAASAGIEIGAHSRLHPQLDQLPAKLLRDELSTSKAQLEDKLGFPVTGLAYPFGYSNARVRAAAQELGHGYACAVGNMMVSKESDLLALPRLTIRRSTGMLAFQQVVSGSNVQRIYFKDRALTKGWAMVRRTRAAVGSVSRGK
jgi:peptidoglycan/xylan/chitin deacetylase (PgdA/CDA1 family)